MKTALCFDDVLLVPRFSYVESRSQVNTSSNLLPYSTPVVSSNMDTVTGVEMAKALYQAGAVGCLHRFWSPADNVSAYKAVKESGFDCWVSVGCGEQELARASMLKASGANTFVLDVAHGAALHVVKQALEIRKIIGDESTLIVGNFATRASIDAFIGEWDNLTVFTTGPITPPPDGISQYEWKLSWKAINPQFRVKEPDMWKVGIGGGSACITRTITGHGMPTLASILDISPHYPCIADGGIRGPDDFVKSLAAGACMVMCGGLFAGCDETPGETFYSEELCLWAKQYRGSASLESYQVQGKISNWRIPEGESFPVPIKGSAREQVRKLNAALRGMSYSGASNLTEFQNNYEFIQITANGVRENGAHGKKS